MKKAKCNFERKRENWNRCPTCYSRGGTWNLKTKEKEKIKKKLKNITSSS